MERWVLRDSPFSEYHFSGADDQQTLPANVAAVLLGIQSEFLPLTNGQTFYPGIGADEAIAELHNLVGRITASWAEVEDQLFQVFVIAVAGTWLVGDIRPYRAVFFAVSSYGTKMRLVHDAMKARYGENGEVLSSWKDLKGSLDGFSELRNKIAHLVPMARPSIDPTAKANVRLVPPFWKSSFPERDFDKLGYSVDQLWQALGPYWGYHPRIHGPSPPIEGPSHQLGYRLQEFIKKIQPPIP
jgi:hypothetical protein